MFSNTVIKQELRIAGKNAGKAVTIAPEHHGVYEELVRLARGGNYWAETTVRALHQLAAGRLHQNNIFIKPGPVHKGGREEFVMILPGCKVTVEKQPEDSYKILRFEMDLNYGALMNSDKQPGLYQAELEPKGWATVPLKGGKLTKKEDRLVAICNSGSENADKAADAAAPSISNTSISTSYEVNKNGFDLHFTPGKRKIGGMINSKDARRPLESQNLHVSALLLARTMFQARKTKGVRWVSELGGSGVLTQALKILADQGVELKDHTAFLYRPMTSPLAAVKAAHAVGLKLDRDFTKVEALDWIGTREMPEVIGQRLKNEALHGFQGVISAAG